MPWAGILSLGDDQLFFGPKHSIYAFFMILFVLFDFILLFVCQICHVNCETENKSYLCFKKRVKHSLSLTWLIFFGLLFLFSPTRRRRRHRRQAGDLGRHRRRQISRHRQTTN